MTPHQPGVLASALLSIGVIGAAALIWGGWRMIVREKQTQKGLLMFACAVVLMANVLIWSV